VVHNRDAVRPATRQRVLDVIEALGYIPTVPRRVWRGSGKK
jgi:DNA-binding LacI/PurR family transcriptional regulator